MSETVSETKIKLTFVCEEILGKSDFFLLTKNQKYENSV